MKRLQKRYFWVVIFAICPILFLAYGQKTPSSYKTLWQTIQSDDISPEKKLEYLDLYARLARKDQLPVEEFKALKRKSLMINQFDTGIAISQQMLEVAQKADNDSLLQRAHDYTSSLYYKNRDYALALDNALLADSLAYLLQNDYAQHATYITFGNTYLATKNYDKAKEYFRRSANYYRNPKDYNHLRGYITSVYSVAKACLLLQQTDTVPVLLSEIEEAITHLRPKDVPFEKGYLHYVQGMYDYETGKYAQAKEQLISALPVLQNNNDFSHEHVAYLYLGKIALQENNKPQARDYFLKIDQLFTEKSFLNYELREAYSYLKDYYEEENDLENQLHVTNQMLALNKQFEREQHSISNTIHYELENQAFEKTKARLESELKTARRNRNLYIAAGITAVVILISALFWSVRQKNKWKKQVGQWMKENESLSNLIFEMPKTNLKEEDVPELSKTEKRVLAELEAFETEKGYLQAIKLQDLADRLNINRNSLTKILQKHRGKSSTEYLGFLRTRELIQQIKDNPKLLQYSQDALATDFGFGSVKTMSRQFKENTKMNVGFFLKEAQKNLDKVA